MAKSPSVSLTGWMPAGAVVMTSLQSAILQSATPEAIKQTFDVELWRDRCMSELTECRDSSDNFVWVYNGEVGGIRRDGWIPRNTKREES